MAPVPACCNSNGLRGVPMSNHLIDIQDAVFTWPDEQAFRLSVPRLEVGRGERVLLSGPSGSGKSTLLSLICGIVTPQSGRISILGTDLASLSSMKRDRFRAEHIGVIFQQFNLLPYASLTDNVLLPLSFASARRARTSAGGKTLEGEARRLLSALGLDAVEPTARARNLSIGQQQRVAVARALIGGPELVVADEPTSALDRYAQDRFLDLMFRQLAETGATLLMVSHDERLASRFDRVVQLNDILRRAASEAEATTDEVAA